MSRINFTWINLDPNTLPRDIQLLMKIGRIDHGLVYDCFRCRRYSIRRYYVVKVGTDRICEICKCCLEILKVPSHDDYISLVYDGDNIKIYDDDALSYYSHITAEVCVKL